MRTMPRRITRKWMAALALSIDTPMANAFLRALGIPVPARRFRKGVIVLAGRGGMYEGVEECMRNRRTAMDGRYGQA